MEELSVLNKPRLITDRKIRTNFNETKHSSEETKTNPVIDNIITEGDENFLNYLNCHGLANEPNVLVLPSKRHYYYDHEDFKGITTLVNLKKLNLIKHLDDFLHSICDVLSPSTNFIGCFSDRKTQKEIGATSRMYNKFINFLDSKIDIEIDRKDISRLLESHGLKVIDMTEINGLTYFRTQHNGRPVI